MISRSVLALPLAVLATAGCGSDPCTAPAGCKRTTGLGSCACAEWETVSVRTVTLKYVVVGIVYAAPGSTTEAVYGYSSGNNMPPASSDSGARLRAVVRGVDGREAVAPLAAVAADPGTNLVPVNEATLEYFVAGGDGQSGSADGWHWRVDLPSAHANDVIAVWTNPTLTVATDAAGGRKVSWGWTPVGACYWPTQLACSGPHALTFTVAELDGTAPVADYYKQTWLATLTPDERAGIVRYHPLLGAPGRDATTLAADPRFASLGTAHLTPDGSSYPGTSWTPCAGALDDPAFAPLAQSEIGLAWSSETLVLQHGVVAHGAACVAQQPGLVMGTATPGCEITAGVWVDKAFGTLLFAPVVGTGSCTTR